MTYSHMRCINVKYDSSKPNLSAPFHQGPAHKVAPVQTTFRYVYRRSAVLTLQAFCTPLALTGASAVYWNVYWTGMVRLLFIGA